MHKAIVFSPPLLQNSYLVDLYSLGSYLLFLSKHRHFHFPNIPLQRYLWLILCLCNYAEASAHKQNHIFSFYQASPTYWSTLLTSVLSLFLLINCNIYFHILMLLTGTLFFLTFVLLFIWFPTSYTSASARMLLSMTEGAFLLTTCPMGTRQSLEHLVYLLSLFTEHQ